ncbi:hypothetical protein MMC30_009363 [Trapelia coarctata]|nr:hypothetical protein [Trapelia coarctata]
MAATSTDHSSSSTRLSQISGHLASIPSAGPTTSLTSDTPSLTPHQSNSRAPSAILIFAWGGGTTPQLSRYAAKYSELYPSARIVALGSPYLDFLPWPIRSPSQKEEGFDQILEACPPSDTGTNGVLVHILSNGGSYRFCLMATRYLLTTNTTLPIRAMVIDSAPSPSSPRSKANALTVGMGLTGLVRLVSLSVLHLVLSLEWMWSFVTWQNEFVSFARRVLNDPAVVKRSSARVYIYSREDKVVGWRGIVAHAEEAGRQGFRVETEMFAGSPHIGHAKMDPERYWNIIRRTWDRASGIGDVSEPKCGELEKAKTD